MINTDNVDIEIIDFLDLIDNTLSKKFIETWRYRFSERFLRQFQLKLLSTLGGSKPLKATTLFNYLTNKCSYNKIQVLDFFEAIDLEIYYPVIKGPIPRREV